MDTRKKFVDEKIRVFWDKHAEDLLKKNNDQKYLTDDGIKKIDSGRWEIAQNYEHKTWKDAVNANDDNNLKRSILFNNYADLRKCHFENAIELGCGPFTNIRLISQVAKIDDISLLDPLIEKYLVHPNCAYKTRQINGIPVSIVKSTIEEFNADKKYDLVIMINVINHCYDLEKIFDCILDCTSEGSFFVFGELFIGIESIRRLVQNRYNAGHPLLPNKEYIESFLSKYFNSTYIHDKRVEDMDCNERSYIGVRK